MSKIEWTGETWNPVTGCTKISQGCKHCYAETMANRLQAMGARGYENGFKLTVQGQDAFDKPLKRKKPTTYFVCSMSDLFHDSVPFETIDRVIEIIEQCPQHTFQILTKRSERMTEYFKTPYVLFGKFGSKKTVPKNVWLGVTVENQQAANERIPHLLSIDASVRFLSCEPLLEKVVIPTVFLEPLKFDGKECSYPDGCGLIDLVIVGGESGHNARPMHPDWARSIRDQCSAAGVPFFFKQWGEWLPNCQIEKKEDELKVFKTSSFIATGDSIGSYKVGKKKAGRLLDGVLHDAMPNV